MPLMILLVAFLCIPTGDLIVKDELEKTDQRRAGEHQKEKEQDGFAAEDGDLEEGGKRRDQQGKQHRCERDRKYGNAQTREGLADIIQCDKADR